MPCLIPDALVERVAGRLQASRQHGRRPGGAERLLREQPELLSFVLAGTAQLGAESRALGVFLSEVIYDSFRLSGRPTRPLRPADFVTMLHGNRDMALRVGRAHDRFAERYLRHSRTLRQPALIRYVTGALLGPDGEPPGRCDIPRDELGPLFVVLKSVIDVLDQDLGRVELPAEPA